MLAIGTVLLVAGVVFSAFNAGFPISSLGIIKGWFIIPVLFSFSTYSIFKSDFDKTHILKALYASISCVAVVAITYAVLRIFTYDGRLSAFYPSPNYLAMYLVPGIFIGYFLIERKNKKNCFLHNLLIIFSLLAIIIAIYLTKSHAAWLSAAIAYPFFILSIKSSLFRYFWRVSLIVIIFAFIFLAYIDTDKIIRVAHIQERSSLASRVMIWKSAMLITIKNPIWGIGPGQFQQNYLSYQKYFPPYLEWAVPQPHNLYLAFWLQAGIVGLCGFLLVIISSFKKILTSLKNKKTASFAVMVACILISFLFWGFLDTPYWKNDLAFIFWLFTFIH